jgi:NDP-sugar pyrophosphorylase family protein
MNKNSGSPFSTENLLDLNFTIAAKLFDGCDFPWQALPKISDFIRALGPTLDKQLFDEVKPEVWVAKSATVAPTACVNAPCIIDEGAEVRHCAFIRGNAIIGKGAVVGNSTEVKNAVLFDKAQAPHYNYVGDSVYGYRAHTGAGAVTSNLKSDKSPVTVMCDGQKVETGLKKFGGILGDNVEVGCNSVLCPGSVIGREATIYPLSRVRGFVPARHIFKAPDDIVEKR